MKPPCVPGRALGSVPLTPLTVWPRGTNLMGINTDRMSRWARTCHRPPIHQQTAPPGPGAGRVFIPKEFGKSKFVLSLWGWTSGLPYEEMVNFCCITPTNLWKYILTALRRQHECDWAALLGGVLGICHPDFKWIQIRAVVFSSADWNEGDNHCSFSEKYSAQ